MRDVPVNSLLRIIHLVHFDMDLFKSICWHANDCKDMVQGIVEKIMIQNGL